MEHSLIIDIAICVIAAWVIGVACQVARQPLLLAYLVAGFAIGPNGFQWVTKTESIQIISEIGLALLLFMIGLEIDLKKMFKAGKALTVTAVTQIFGCVLLGLVFFKLTGLATGWLETVYLAVAAAMSSTVIIIKLLYDKRELETLAGRITLGVLVLQDLVVILFLAVQPNLKNPAPALLALALGKVLLLVGVGYVVSRFLLPPVFRFVARQPELVLVGSLAWCFALAGFAEQLQLSREMGALVAGVMVSTFPYTLDVAAKVTSIRDFFVTLFFVGLGMRIPVPTLSLLGGVLLFSAFLIGSRLLTVFVPLHLMRMGHRVSLTPAINLSQVSELSLVLLTLGRNAGDVSQTTFNVAAFAFAFLAVDSTYAILKSESILRRAAPWLRRLGFRDLESGQIAATDPRHDAGIFLLGFSWVASSLLEEIRQRKPTLLPELRVIDFNPQVNPELRRRGVGVIYGDISQRDVLLHGGVAGAKLILCTLPDLILKGTTNLRLLRQVRDIAPEARVIVHAERLADVPLLYQAGAAYVLVSRLLEAGELLNLMEASEKNLLEEKRKTQSHALQERDEVLP